MFESIEIENYKKIRKIKIEDFKQFNLIIGKNNSGKTSILEAIFYSINPGNTTLTFKAVGQVKISLDRSVKEAVFWEPFFHRLDTDRKVKLTSKLIKPSLEERILTIIPKYEKQPDSEINNFRNGQDYYATKIQKLVIGLIYDFTIKKNNTEVKLYHSTIEYNKLEPVTVYPGMEIQPFNVKNDPSYESTTNGRLINPRNLYANLDGKFGKIVIKKQEKQIINYMKIIDSKLEDIILVGDQIYLDLGEDFKSRLPISFWGEGTSKAFAILLDLVNLPNSIILIDEIENGLHYSTMEIFFDFIFKVARSLNIQLFMTTHSYECIRAVRNSISKLNEEDDFRLYRIESKDDKLKSIKYSFREISTSIEQEWEIR
ncbi:MAG: ATP/GTP-binding protein [Promethearchaeota archaeon]